MARIALGARGGARPHARTPSTGREGVYSRDMGRGNSREGGGECTVGTWVGATVGRGGGVYSRDMGRGNSREGGGGPRWPGLRRGAQEMLCALAFEGKADSGTGRHRLNVDHPEAILLPLASTSARPGERRARLHEHGLGPCRRVHLVRKEGRGRVQLVREGGGGARARSGALQRRAPAWSASAAGARPSRDGSSSCSAR